MRVDAIMRFLHVCTFKYVCMYVCTCSMYVLTVSMYVCMTTSTMPTRLYVYRVCTVLYDIVCMYVMYMYVCCSPIFWSRDQEHEESGRSSHRLLSVKHTSVLLMGKLLPMNTRMQIARDCCAGLAFLHSRNFMHCDIKSLNFLGWVNTPFSYITVLIYYMYAYVCMYLMYVWYANKTFSFSLCVYVCMYAVTSDLVVKLADLGEARDVSRANETAKFMPR